VVYVDGMTAVQIIEEIKQLAPEERARVEDFVVLERADESRQLSGSELGGLAERLVETDDLEAKAVLREEITKGFYGL